LNLDRVVIGAGIAGLLAAKRAAERGERVLVVEAAEQAGGAIRQEELAGLHLDIGPEAISTINPEIQQALLGLGLTEDQIVYPGPQSAWIVGGGKKHKIPKGFMGIPANLDDPELLEIFSAEEIARAKDLDSQPFANYQSVADLVTKRLGEEFLERSVAPVFTGVYATDPENLSPGTTMPQLLAKAMERGSLLAAVAEIATRERAGSNVLGIKGGLGALVDQLFSDLSSQGVEFEFSKAVESVDFSTPMITKIAGGRAIKSERLSIAASLGFYRSAELSNKELTSLARQIPSTRSAIVMMHLRSSELSEQPLGPGALVRRGGSHLAKATSHSNAKWGWLNQALADDEHIVRLSFDPDRIDPESLTDSQLLAEVKDLYEISELELFGKQVGYWSDVLSQSRGGNFERFREAAKASPEVEFCGGSFAGSSIAAIVLDHQKRRAA
jgi:protoporphyrinogen/coproporphyrinogen III oxidase